MRQTITLLLCSFCYTIFSQNTPNTQDAVDPIELHMYGRLGVHSSLSGKNLGARLNLSGQAAIGGRLEENDYMEIQPVFNISHFAHIEEGPLVRFFLLTQIYSGDNTYILYNTKINFTEAYLQAIDTTSSGKPWEIWVGSRYKRSRTIDLIDYWNFDNISGHGLGINYGKFGLSFISNVPYSDNSGNPYGNGTLNQYTQKYILRLDQRFQLNKVHDLYVIGELHLSDIDSLQSSNFTDDLLQFQDYGLVAGIQHHIDKGIHQNYLTARLGTRIANGPGDDGWSSRTFITYGNPSANDLSYKGGYGINITENYLFTGSDKMNLQAYAIYRMAKGATGETLYDSLNPTANSKWDLSVGVRPTYFISDKFHLITEAHYSTREYQQGHNGISTKPGLGRMYKLTLAPTFVPSGKRSQDSRPHFRVVYAIALYNKVVKDYGLAQYYESNNRGNVGQYLGVKSEWWF